ncbi:hypothetical protein PQU92_17740 [Asticcacaulis sp. BYS171W]|uniref:Sulfotransferase domain-containing protein n=1 Tax=Asticcacaulis aquaticus TaxID=2984212 RepID=A0ABT5HYJ8_9CAUL|nr:hypothetical protein [Asticcacaulis aquaticus]MDC7685129.1 hypothetical protein [Asticcacaulis aquaticus]
MSAFETLYHLMTALPKADGTLSSELVEVVRNIRTGNRQCLLAFPPKVAGTFLRTALVELLGQHYESYLSRGAYANVTLSHDLYFPTLLNQHIVSGTRPGAAVMHLHLNPSRHTTALVEAFDIPVVIGTRDILDTLVSAKNMCDAAPPTEADSFSALGAPWHDLTEAEQRHVLVHVLPAWYARFYGAWMRYSVDCHVRGLRPPLWLRYDDLVAQPVDLIGAILTHVDPTHTYAPADIAAVHERTRRKKADVRLNKGISGRGEAYFTPEEKEIIHQALRSAGEREMIGLGILPDPAVSARYDAPAVPQVAE